MYQAFGLVDLSVVSDFIVVKVAPHDLGDDYGLRAISPLRDEARDGSLAFRERRVRSHAVDRVAVAIDKVGPCNIRAAWAPAQKRSQMKILNLKTHS